MMQEQAEQFADAGFPWRPEPQQSFGHNLQQRLDAHLTGERLCADLVELPSRRWLSQANETFRAES